MRRVPPALASLVLSLGAGCLALVALTACSESGESAPARTEASAVRPPQAESVIASPEASPSRSGWSQQPFVGAAVPSNLGDGVFWVQLGEGAKPNAELWVGTRDNPRPQRTRVALFELARALELPVVRPAFERTLTLAEVGRITAQTPLLNDWLDRELAVLANGSVFAVVSPRVQDPQAGQPPSELQRSALLVMRYLGAILLEHDVLLPGHGPPQIDTSDAFVPNPSADALDRLRRQLLETPSFPDGLAERLQGLHQVELDRRFVGPRPTQGLLTPRQAIDLGDRVQVLLSILRQRPSASAAETRRELGLPDGLASHLWR